MGSKRIDPVEILAEVALALPETERLPFGDDPNRTFRVRGKIFAMLLDDGASFMCKAPPGVQAQLVEQEPDRFFVPPYTGRNGWIGVRLVDVDRDELHGILLDSWKLTAPKRLHRLLPDDDRD